MIGSILIKLREDNNLSTNELADIIEIDEEKLIPIEENKIKADNDIKSKIAMTFNIPLDELMSDDDLKKLESITNVEDTLAKKLERMRIGTGMIRKEFSQKIGIEENLLNDWENAISVPNFSQLIKIADYFQVSLDSLFNREFKSESYMETDYISLIEYLKENNISVHDVYEIIQRNKSTYSSANKTQYITYKRKV